MSRETEIDQCFKENPDLLNKSPKQLALFFYIQGELASSHLREAATHRANHYRHRLGQLDRELMDRTDDEWKKLCEK